VEGVSVHVKWSQQISQHQDSGSGLEAAMKGVACLASSCAADAPARHPCPPLPARRQDASQLLSLLNAGASRACPHSLESGEELGVCFQMNFQVLGADALGPEVRGLPPGGVRRAMLGTASGV
jgi:hypothetical protein